MEFTNNEISFILNQIEEIKKIKELPFLDLVCGIIDIKKIIIDKVKCLKEKSIELEKRRNDLYIKYCLKDEKGKPILINRPAGVDERGKPIYNEVYAGLNPGLNPEFDRQIEEIKKDFDTLGEQKVVFTQDELNRLDTIKIKSKLLDTNLVIKKEFVGDMYEALSYFINKEE